MHHGHQRQIAALRMRARLLCLGILQRKCKGATPRAGKRANRQRQAAYRPGKAIRVYRIRWPSPHPARRFAAQPYLRAARRARARWRSTNSHGCRAKGLPGQEAPPRGANPLAHLPAALPSKNPPAAARRRLVLPVPASRRQYVQNDCTNACQRYPSAFVRRPAGADR